MYKVIIFVIVSLFGVIGCSMSPKEQEQYNKDRQQARESYGERIFAVKSKNSTGQTFFNTNQNSATIVEYDLSDGTHCASVLDYRGVAMSCNWKN